MGAVMKTATPGPWRIVKSYNGFVIVRTWSSGFYQRMRAPHLHTEEEARAVLSATPAP